MTRKQKRNILREILRIYEDCPERVAAYTRWRWFATAATWVLIFTAVFLSFFHSVNTLVCVGIGFLGGIAFGAALSFAGAARAWPLAVRYTTLQAGEIKKDLAELTLARDKGMAKPE